MLRATAQLMADSSAILSVLVRNQAGEVLKAAIQTGDLAAAEQTLTAEWGRESLFGSSVRLFTPDSLQAMLKAASLAVAAVRGVRVISDYLPPSVSRSAGIRGGFWSWSASWAAGRSLPQWPATRIT